ncbi:MAG: metallophosphoesterase [Clostridia bacterium]|nr:metallophosphoesterase [Clostridia bacterium]
MKRNISYVIILFAAVLLLVSCSVVIPEPSPRPSTVTGSPELTVFVCSDIHLLSDSLTDETAPKSKLTSDGRCQDLDYVLMGALTDEVNRQKPDYLVITGDLTFNGEYESHTAVASLLSEIGDETKVLVIPGNHDYNNLSSMQFKESKMSPTRALTMEEFPSVYADFGYTGAYSYDEETLSYCYRLSDSLWGLFLDTNISRFNREESMQTVGGQVSGSTFRWIEKMLKEAREAGADVISFSHHNLITHHPSFESRYTLGNAAAIKELFASYGVKLNMSGHLHIQSIKEENGFYDISSASLLDYGCRYGVIGVYPDAFSYSSFTLSTDAVDIPSYTFKKFYDMYYAKNSLKTDFGKNTEAVKDFMAKANCYYFDGDTASLRALISENSGTYRLLMKKMPSDYFRYIIETAKEPDSHSAEVQRH